MRLWKIVFIVILILSCTVAIPTAPNRPEFCYQKAQVDGDIYSGPKDRRLREELRERSNSLLLEITRVDCERDISGFLATPEEVERLPSLCQYFRLEDYRELREALIDQVILACEIRTDDLCRKEPISIEGAARACVERNSSRVLEALALRETSIEVIE